VSATASRTLNFAKVMACRGHSVYIFTLRESVDAPLDELFEGCRIIRFRNGVYPVRFFRERRSMYIRFLIKGHGFPFLSALVKTIKRYSIDVIHCANYFPSLFGACLNVFVRRPIIGDIHASAMIEGLERGAPFEGVVGMLVERLIDLSLDALLVPTTDCANYFRGINSWKGGPIFVLPSCVDLDQFRARPSLKARAEMGVSPKERLLLYYGSPYPENIEALELFLRAIYLLREMGYNVKGVVAGDFKSDRRVAEDIFFTGWLSQEELARYIGAVDLAILPIYLKSKGISTRVLECMASGRATITTRNGAAGLESAVDKGGLLVADSVEEMVKSAALLLEDDSMMNAVGEAARRTIEKELSPTSIGKRLESIYEATIESCLDGPSPRPGLDFIGL